MLVGSDALATSLGTVHIRYAGLGAYGVGGATFSPTVGSPYSTGSVYVGAYIFEADPSQSGTGLGLDLPETFGGFCVDMTQWARLQYELYDVVPLAEAPRTTVAGAQAMGETRAGLLQNLWHDHYDPAWVAGGSYSPTQSREAEAFAAAVWEIAFEEEDNLLDVSNGALVAWGIEEAALANSWLSGLDADGPQSPLYGLVHESYQDFVVLIPASPGGQGDIIPEPHTVLGLLMGVFYLRRYLRGRKGRLRQSRTVGPTGGAGGVGRQEEGECDRT